MSQKASGYERMDGDRYFTPRWPVEALLSVEKFSGPVVDPCAGGWDLVHTVSHHCGVRAFGFDIQPPPVALSYMPMFWTQDFLDWQGSTIHGEPEWRDIITNPPYGKGGRLAVQFIEHALELTRPRFGKVAMLLRVDFDSADGRRPIFDDHPAFAAKYTLTKRIRWENLEQSASGPTENHMWAVWDWSKRRDTTRAYGYLPLKTEK